MAVDPKMPEDAPAFSRFAPAETEEKATDFSDAESFFNLPDVEDDENEDEEKDQRR
jgi:hypothetical protein